MLGEVWKRHFFFFIVESGGQFQLNFFYLRIPSDVKLDSKFRILGLKSPKIGHWKKMLKLIEMTQNGFFFFN